MTLSSSPRAPDVAAPPRGAAGAGSPVLGTVGAGVTVLTWALAFPAIRLALRDFTPWELGAARLAVASLALGCAALARRPARPPRRLWPRLALAGLLGQTLYQGLLMTGEVHVPAGTASIVIATAPLFAALAAGVLLREPLRPALPGLVLAFAGAVLVGLSSDVGGGVAVLAVLAAALCQGLYHVVVKPLVEQLGAFAATAWSLWAGTAMAVPFLPAAVGQARVASGAGLLAVLSLGVLSSAVGYGAWSLALRHSPVARATAALYLVPLVALALGWGWLGERPAPLALAGGTLAVLGVVLVRRVPTPVR